MADVNIESVYESITEKLNSISNAKYGETVRKNIVDALTLIAQRVDQEIDHLSVIVESAEGTIASNASQYEYYSGLATAAEQTATNLDEARKAITNVLNNITNITTNPIAYKEYPTGVTPQYGFDTDLPRIEHVESTNSWILHFPRVPEFKQIKVNRLNFRNFASNPSSFKDSVQYDPNAGILTINVIDPLSRLSVKTKVVKYDEATFGNANSIPVNLEYDSTGTAPTIVLTVPHGQNGGGSNILNYRPYFERVIWNNANYTDPTTATFPEQAQLTGAYHITVNQKYSTGGYSLSSSAYPAIDAVIIRFRKSVNNTSQSDFKLANTMGATLAFDDNRDYDTEYSLFLPRGCSFRMTVFDVAGRMISRPVYWIDGTSYSRVIWGGSRTGVPTWLFGRTDDMNAKLSSLTGDNATRQKLLKTYTSGILFGNATVDGKGDLVEYAWWGTSDYQLTKHDKTSSGEWYNPAANQNKNKAYNQFLIPISITGIWYQMPETEIFNFPGNNA